MVTSNILDINQFVKYNKWLWLLIVFFAVVSKSHAISLSKKQKEIKKISKRCQTCVLQEMMIK